MKDGNLRWALVLAAIHVVLALLYARATPFLTPGFLMYQRTPEGRPAPVIDVGAPDELQHVAYVKHLAEGRGFPVLDPKDPELGRRYQSHQPPAFYLLAAGWSKIVGNSYLGLRSLNALIGGIAVLGVYFLALWGLGTERRAYAIGAAAFAALLPMNVALSGAISNDPLLFCLSTWVLALTAVYGKDGLCVKRGLLLGALIGVALLTKTTALALLPAVAVGLMLAQKRPALATVLPGAVLALAMGGVWWMRNQSLYGDPLAMGVFNAAFQNSPQATVYLQAFGPKGYWIDMVGWWTVRSYLGAFGYMDIFLSPNLYRLATLVFVTLASFGILAAFKKGEDESDRAFHLMNTVFFLIVLALFVQFNKTYFQGQARYLFPAIGPMAVAIALGAGNLVKSKPWIPLGVLASSLLIVNLFVLNVLPTEFAIRTDQTNGAPQASNQ